MEFVIRDLGEDTAFPTVRYQADRVEDGVAVKSYGGATPEEAVHNAQVAVLMTESGPVPPEVHARFIEALRAARGVQ